MGTEAELRDKAIECFVLGEHSSEPKIATEFIQLGHAYERLADREHQHPAIGRSADPASTPRRSCPECHGLGALPAYVSRVLPSGTEVLEVAGRDVCCRCSETGQIEL